MLRRREGGEELVDEARSIKCPTERPDVCSNLRLAYVAA